MNYPKHLRTRKARIAYWFFKQKYYFITGKDRIGGWIFGLVRDAGLIIMGLKMFNVDFRNHPVGTVIFVVFALIGIWVLGRIYVYFNLDKFENLVNEERSPLVNKIYESLPDNKKEEVV